MESDNEEGRILRGQGADDDNDGDLAVDEE